MASTYSQNLKIELIGTGEQSGTWGTTTNTNLGTALEQAIVGYGNPNFASDADLTISLSDSNATQTARNFSLRVTSGVSLTTTRNLIVPTIQKPYLIFNDTTGGQSIIVKTSAGTGVTVPNGARTLVYVDGTNVVSEVSYLASLALGSALPVTSGGTGVTTSTGSGSVVLSTSPTLTTPNLGTPSTAVLTNATGLPLTTGVTGTLPVANGGTGATSLTANNVLLGNGTSAVQVVAPGTSGNVLTSNGTTWTSGTAPVASVNGQTGAVTTTTHLGVGAVQILWNFSGTAVASGSTSISAASLGYPTNAVGTFAQNVQRDGNVTVPGTGRSGSPNTAAVSGTWQSMSQVLARFYDPFDADVTIAYAGLFVRVS